MGHAAEAWRSPTTASRAERLKKEYSYTSQPSWPVFISIIIILIIDWNLGHSGSRYKILRKL
jgi:hypothetical protein